MKRVLVELEEMDTCPIKEEPHSDGYDTDPLDFADENPGIDAELDGDCSDDEYEQHVVKRSKTIEETQTEEPRNNGYEVLSPTNTPVSNDLVRIPLRDPRLNRGNVGKFNESSSLSIIDKRNAFVQGTIKSAKLIDAMPIQSSDYMPEPIKKIREHCIEAQKRLKSKPDFLYSNIPSVPLAAGGTEYQRSPLVANNNSAVFMAQATVDNVQDAMIGNRFRNIPLKLQNIGNLIGADLDSISRSMSNSVEPITMPVFHQNNTSSIHVEPVEAVPVRNVVMVDVGMQTTENTGGFDFSLTIDQISKLTKEQRIGLEVFKRVRFECKAFS